MRSAFQFRDNGVALTPLTFEEYVAELDQDPSEGVLLFAEHAGAGVAMPVSTVPPSENEHLTADDLAFIEGVREESASENGVKASALTSEATISTIAPLNENGCQGGGGGNLPLILGLFALAGFMVRRAGRKTPVVMTILVLVASPIVLASVAHAAPERLIYGYVSFWDTRPKFDDVGSRFPTCDTTNITCIPGATGCCFTEIPNATIELHHNGNVEDIGETTNSGMFVLRTNSDWSGTTFALVVRFTQDSSPLNYRVEIPPSTTATAALKKIYIGANSQTYFGNINYTAAGDTSSLLGDVASIWTTVRDADAALRGEGEFRQIDKTYNSTSPDLITFRLMNTPLSTNTSCLTSNVYIDNGLERTSWVAHEFGHVLHGRVVGCLGGQPAFPIWYAEADGWRTSEATTITEGLPNVVRILTYWDPDTVEWPSIQTAFATDCTDNSSYDNSNDLAAERNTALGIWDMIDTKSTYTDTYSDYIDLTLSEVLDSLLTLKNTSGTQGQNRTADENYLAATFVPCQVTEGCGAGEFCMTGICRAGDPHGGNLRDWLHHMAADHGGTEASYWQTMVSNPCIGSGDNSFPFTGGYRID